MMKSFREALKSGVPQIGLCIMYSSPGVVERIGADWDWLWLDGQHGEADRKEMLALVRACELIQRPAFVRVPMHEPGPIGVALDMDAAGVIVPCVDNPEQARTIVHAAKFPPLGGRSYGGRRVIDRRGRLYSDTANVDTMLVLQIETPEGIANADAIAAMPGVDALFLGPDDIMLRRGHSMNAPKNKAALWEDMLAVTKACRKHGKAAMTVGRGPEWFTLCMEAGFNMIVGGSDVVFLTESSKKSAEEARALAKGFKPGKGGPAAAGLY